MFVVLVRAEVEFFFCVYTTFFIYSACLLSVCVCSLSVCVCEVALFAFVCAKRCLCCQAFHHSADSLMNKETYPTFSGGAGVEGGGVDWQAIAGCSGYGGGEEVAHLRKWSHWLPLFPPPSSLLQRWNIWAAAARLQPPYS